jgi:formate hydrogenlyase subunit 6/NADH:ubiquinone oxidoreductase subunit I
LAGTIALIVLSVLVLTGLTIWLLGERGHPFRISTWKVLKTGGLKNLFNLKLIHLYLYGRWTQHYIGHQKKKTLPKMKDSEKKKWAENTHFKVLTPPDSRSIITLDHKVDLRSNEQVIPYSTARDIVLNGPPEIAVYDCGCRLSSPSPCEPTQVCMVVGQPFVDFVLKHHPKSARLMTPEEALELLEAEHQRGRIQTAWFKDICFGRFYAICNCCPCCCIGIQAITKHNIPMAVSSGYVAQVNASLCTSCGECEPACAFSAIRTDGYVEVEWESCMGCGVCVQQCPSEALSLIKDERKGEPLHLGDAPPG